MKRFRSAFFLALLAGLLLFQLPGTACSQDGDVEAEGTLSVTLYENPLEGFSETKYSLEEESAPRGKARRFSVGFPPGKGPHLRSGSRVRVRGKLQGELLQVAAVESGGMQVVSEPAAALVSGEGKVAVILVNLLDRPLPSACTPAAVKDLMFLSASSVSACYKETSFNQMWFSGSTFGPFLINYDSTVTDNLKIAAAANTAATAAGVDLTPYQMKVYIVPPCAMWGSAVGLAGINVFVRGDYWSSKQVYAHELGHTVGMNHAATPANEYGDWSDFMGNGPSLTQVNAPHKIKMGWTSAANVITATSSGTYTVSLLEQAGLGPQVLKIVKPDTAYTYYFSYRVPVGFDTALSSTYAYRLNVHREFNWPLAPNEVFLPGPDTTYLTALADGQSFSDSVNGITVTMTSRTSTHATVGVTFEWRSGLSGHWKLDEGAGTTAGDSSVYGGTGTLTNGPVWTTGKMGGALSCDGVDDYVKIGTNETLAAVGMARNLTLAGWFRPDTAPASSSKAYVVVVRHGVHEGLVYTNDKRFSMRHKLWGELGEVDASAMGTAAHEPGSFYHVAGVLDRNAGTTKLYVNGVLEGTASWTPNALTSKGLWWGYWRIGNIPADPPSPDPRFPNPPSHPPGYVAADGTIDDVRIYHRALTGVEITALAKGPRALKRDFDGDGKADLLFRHSSSGEVYLWLLK